MQSKHGDLVYDQKDIRDVLVDHFTRVIGEKVDGSNPTSEV